VAEPKAHREKWSDRGQTLILENTTGTNDHRSGSVNGKMEVLLEPGGMEL